MKSEQIKQITNKAIEQLIAALNEGCGEALPQPLVFSNALLSRSQIANLSAAADGIIPLIHKTREP